MKKIKFAVIGCGSIGQRHVAVLDAEAGAEIVAVCDIDEQKCKKIAETYPGITAYTDYEKMLREGDFEVVHICTPHGLHAPMSIAAAKAKKHILVEKPMAISIEDCNKMIRAAKENDVLLMVVKQNRYNIPIRLAKEALDSKKLGRIFMVQCDVLWNRYEGYYSESDWRGRKELEGGALYTQASHFIDLLIWWFGDVIKAKTFIDTKNHHIEIEDCGTSVLQFENGVMGTLNWTTCVYNKNYEGSIMIIGEFGTIKIGGQYLNKIEYWDVRAYPLSDTIDFTDKPNAYGKYQGTSSNHDKVVKDVIARLNQDKHMVVEGEEGIRSVKAIEMIYADARK
ncbi:MAG: Gfo/Idh/MocA family protein [Bacteroidia bacterium]